MEYINIDRYDAAFWWLVEEENRLHFIEEEAID
jgi:hypothetical protein